MTYYGFTWNGRQYVEVFVTTSPTTRSASVETGVTYPTFRAAERTVLAKNRAIAS